MPTQMTTTLRSAARKAVMALGVLAVMGAAAAPAFADGRYEHSWRDEHGWRGGEYEHAWRGERFEHRYAYVAPRHYDGYVAPRYYGYTAPRYYAPPPVYYYPTPGFSLDFSVPLR